MFLGGTREAQRRREQGRGFGEGIADPPQNPARVSEPFPHLLEHLEAHCNVPQWGSQITNADFSAVRQGVSE